MTSFYKVLFPVVTATGLCWTGTAVAQELGKPNSGFRDDVSFLKQHAEIVTLTDGKAAVAVAPAYQGRVMTSTVDRENGAGFGWINRKVIKAGLLSDEDRKGKLEARRNNGACPTNFAFAWNRSRTGPAGKTFIGRELAEDQKTVSTVTSK